MRNIFCDFLFVFTFRHIREEVIVCSFAYYNERTSLEHSHCNAYGSGKCADNKPIWLFDTQHGHGEMEKGQTVRQHINSGNDIAYHHRC